MIMNNPHKTSVLSVFSVTSVIPASFLYPHSEHLRIAPVLTTNQAVCHTPLASRKGETSTYDPPDNFR